MSNLHKDQPSIRVCAPPGGRTANIFGVPEPEQPVSMKKHHMQSDIFGCKQETQETVQAKPSRTMTNNIFGVEPEPAPAKSKVYAEKNRSTIFDEPAPVQPSNKPDRQRSNIFAASDPVQNAPARPMADKFKSNIFSSSDSDEQNKRQTGGRQGLRVGYNPINGEPYATKDDVSTKLEKLDISLNNDKTKEESNDETEKHVEQSPRDESTPPSTATEQMSNEKAPVNNGNPSSKNSHTSVRVCHPPGGRSNGPLW